MYYYDLTIISVHAVTNEEFGRSATLVMAQDLLGAIVTLTCLLDGNHYSRGHITSHMSRSLIIELLNRAVAISTFASVACHSLHTSDSGSRTVGSVPLDWFEGQVVLFIFRLRWTLIAVWRSLQEFPVLPCVCVINSCVDLTFREIMTTSGEKRNTWDFPANAGYQGQKGVAAASRCVQEFFQPLRD